MVILQVEVADLAVHEIERDPPVSRHRQAPCACPVAAQLVDAPSGRTFQARDTFDAQQSGQDTADPAHQIAADTLGVIVLNEMLQALVPDTSNPHASIRTVMPYAVSSWASCSLARIDSPRCYSKSGAAYLAQEARP